MNKKGVFGAIIFIIILLLFLAWPVYKLIYAFMTGEETITIDEKWVKYKGNDAKYLISSEDEQVFQITDSIIKWRWDSSNLYARLDEGKTYEIKTQGFRFPLFSDYKNILEVEEIS